MRKKTLRVLVNLFIAVAVPAAWLRMVYGSGNGTLSSTGVNSLKYFTVLSNLLEGLSALVFLAALPCKRRPRPVEMLKYLGAVSVSLTFVIVMIFLGPLYGYGGMFAGASFWMHLAIPLAAAAECVLLCDVPFSRRDNLLAVLPMLLYGAWYVANNLINGVGAWPNTNDWYGFLTWGLPAGIVIFLLIVGLTWLIALILRKAGARALRRGAP